MNMADRVTAIALIKGKKIEYDACSSFRNAYDPIFYEYLGKGEIYSIDGAKMTGSEVKHFFRKRVQK